jgi:radical SAM superfamily enzyme YgiQ (UPF0313 family)
MTVQISFSDLTHTGQTVCANTFPLGVAMVAAYAVQELKDQVNVDIFRYPEDLSNYLESNVPKFACFSVFSWNNNLAHEYARRIKLKHPDTITVFGGVNFPAALDERRDYLLHYSGIDFFIFGEGEAAFVGLYNALKEVDFCVREFKLLRKPVPSVFYLQDGEIIAGEILPRIVDLNTIPSTFANGLSDKFFDGVLTPMVETTRGCPFSCTFCKDGHRYSNKTRRFSQERIHWEMEYVAQRATVNEFIITDLNFGMFEGDVDTARFLAELQNKYDFPRYVVQASAKNHKERIIEISKILRGALAPGASVQSTDSSVLKAIKRKNLTIDELIEVSRTRETDDASSLSEVILCLPGDSKKAHFKSIFDMIDAGMTLLRNHQFMLLKGTEAESREARKAYDMTTGFRVQPRCFGFYKLWGDEFVSAEVEEICIANSTMSYQDYQDCRDIDLMIEIFLNDAIFYDLLQLLDLFGCRRSDFYRRVHETVVDGDSAVNKLYAEYREEEKRNLWHSREEVEAFTSIPENIKSYISGDYGSNEIYKYRAIAVFHHMDVLHEIVFGVAREMLASAIAKGEHNLDLYLSELAEFSLLRKRDFLNTERTECKTFHFDFMELAYSNFTLNPFEHMKPDGVEIRIFHSDRQRTMINQWINQHGTTVNGLGRLLSRAQISAMHRSISDATNPQEFRSKWEADSKPSKDIGSVIECPEL